MMMFFFFFFRAMNAKFGLPQALQCRHLQLRFHRT
jgi:hypothetical protein